MKTGFNLFRKNKRGAVTDLILLMIIGITIVVFFVVITKVAGDFSKSFRSSINILNESFPNTKYSSVTVITDESIGKITHSYQIFKWGAVAIIIAMALSIIIHSYLVRTNPVFFITYLIFLILIVIVSTGISNLYGTLHESGALSQTFAEFFAVSWIFQNFAIFIAVVGFIAGIFLFVNMGREVSV